MFLSPFCPHVVFWNFFVGSVTFSRDTLTSTKEFNGRGNPETFPSKTKQQIAAKLLDMFGYVKLKVGIVFSI